MKKIYLIFALILWSCSHLFSQTGTVAAEQAKAEFRSKQVIPPSPIAAELGKYGNLPVSLFTGTPNITIPIYELKGKFLSVPISLNYDASGYQPQAQATWVGANWSLVAGGVVARSVLGNPDNASNYYGSSSALNPPAAANKFAMADHITLIREEALESQPDVYSFSFPGYSGKFCIKPDYTVLKKKKDMLKITPNLTSGNGSFNITDENGNVYNFSQTEVSQTIPSDAEGGGANITYNYVSSWFLSSITSADAQEQVTFQY